MNEEVKQIDEKNFEVKTTVSKEEVIVYNVDAVNENIRSAQESVARRESELESAQRELAFWQDIKDKLK